MLIARRKADASSRVFVVVFAYFGARCAEIIAEQGIHVLVNLNGHTAGDRNGISAMRPAPVQLVYLAYPGTMGADYIDYNVSAMALWSCVLSVGGEGRVQVVDDNVCPPHHREHYSEKLLRMPHCYQPTGSDISLRLCDVGADRAVSGPGELVQRPVQGGARPLEAADAARAPAPGPPDAGLLQLLPAGPHHEGALCAVDAHPAPRAQLGDLALQAPARRRPAPPGPGARGGRGPEPAGVRAAVLAQDRAPQARHARGPLPRHARLQRPHDRERHA
eukprot:2213638-Rhodomonas_salina.1